MLQGHFARPWSIGKWHIRCLTMIGMLQGISKRPWSIFWKNGYLCME